MSTEPWSKFYWADWRSEPKLRMCCLGARGLWMELLSLMHESDEHAHLLVNGRSPSEQQLAILCGASAAEIRKLKAELEQAGVPGIRDDGVWFSRRMVRDKEKRTRDKANGSKGGNPKILAKDKQGVNPELNQDPLPNVNDEDKARGTRDPEARSQIPEEDTTVSAVAKNAAQPPSDERLVVIRAFDDARAEVFGEEQRRQFPDSTDIVYAERFLTTGADIAWLKAFFLERMAGMLKDSGKKPKSLKYFDEAVVEEYGRFIAAKNKPAGKSALKAEPGFTPKYYGLTRDQVIENKRLHAEKIQELQQGKRA